MRSPLMSQRGLSGRRRAGHTVSYLLFHMYDNQNSKSLSENSKKYPYYKHFDPLIY